MVLRWAIAYLGLAGLTERVRRGVYRLTTDGETLLADPPPRITSFAPTPVFDERLISRPFREKPDAPKNSAVQEGATIVIIVIKMRTIALVSQKGGSGKTTLAVALAVAHELAGGDAVVIDLDPQGSAGVWGTLRGGDPPPVVTTHPPRLARELDAVRGAGTSLAVIDMAPRAAGGAVAAARCADLVLLPCRPSAVDLAALPASLDVGRLTETATAVVLNAVPPRGDLEAQAMEAIRSFEATAVPVTLGTRVAHVRAFTLGRTAQETAPQSSAAAEVEALYRWALMEGGEA